VLPEGKLSERYVTCWWVALLLQVQGGEAEVWWGPFVLCCSGVHYGLKETVLHYVCKDAVRTSPRTLCTPVGVVWAACRAVTVTRGAACNLAIA